MEDKINYMLFFAELSIYDKAFKFHRLKDSLLISLKSIEESYGYTEKLFPGDDRDEIIIKTKKEVYFKVSNKLIENKLRESACKRTKMVFKYELTNDPNLYELVDFYLYDERNQGTDINYITFPNLIKFENYLFSNLSDENDINWDELC